MIKGLYVHVPFCNNPCHYCDFAKARFNYGLAVRYLDELERELEGIGQDSFETIYIGGGTPTALPHELLERLLKMLSRFSFALEYTIEINPESFDMDKAMLLQKYGINRASIGIQSFNEGLLNEMGRSHNNLDTINTMYYLDKAGIKNRSIDLMYGFKSQTMEMLENDLQTAVNMDITHISIYELEVHPDTILGMKGYQLADDEIRYQMYCRIRDFLNEHSYRQYEVSNFCLAHHESRHNMIYWHYEDYYGAGLAASGKIGNERYDNTRNFVEYLKGNHRDNVVRLGREDLRFEAIMMGLRLIEGINIAKYDERYGCQMLKHYRKAIEKNVSEGLLEVSDGYLRTTSEGMLVLNDILVDFMSWL